jgi:hypothetical protein
MVEENKYNIETPGGVTRGEVTTVTDDGGKGKPGAADAGSKKDRSVEKDKAAASEPSSDDKPKAKDEGAKVVSSVTLALTPIQTQTLALAEETGEIRLALRPETDNVITRLGGTTSDQLFGVPSRATVTGRMPAPPALPPRKPPSFGAGAQVEFIQGTEKTLYAF